MTRRENCKALWIWGQNRNSNAERGREGNEYLHYHIVHVYIIILLFILFSTRKNYVIRQVLTRDQTKMVKFMIGRARLQTQICLC